MKTNKKRNKHIIYIGAFICIAVVFTFGWIGFGKSAEAANAKGVVTAESLNVRTGPDYSYDQVLLDKKAVYLFKNNVVTILGEQGRYYKVKFTYKEEKIIGYSCKSYIKVTSGTVGVIEEEAAEEEIEEESLPDAESATTKPTAKARATAKPSSKAKADTTVIIEEEEIPQAPVETIVNRSASGLKLTGKITASSLYVRTKPSTVAEQVKLNNASVALKKNKKVTITKQKIVKGVIWYYVKCKVNGSTVKGYLHGDYVCLTFNEKVNGVINSSTEINVRNTPGVSEDYLLYKDEEVVLTEGDTVVVKKEAVANSKKWFRISFKYRGKTCKGYVLANMVTFKGKTQENVTQDNIKTEETASTSTSAAITATVEPSPSYKETTPTLAKVLQGPLNVRVQPGYDKDYVNYAGNKITLSAGQAITILGNASTNTENWYYISFTYDGTTLNGYVAAQYVTISSAG